jgi:endopeptidase La
MNTQELDNYVSYMQSNYKDILDTDVIKTITTDAITVLTNDFINIKEDDIDEEINLKYDVYSYDMEMIKENDMEPEPKLYNIALLSVMMHFLTQYQDTTVEATKTTKVTKDTENSFIKFLNTYVDIKTKKTIYTLPLESLLTMILHPKKSNLKLPQKRKTINTHLSDMSDTTDSDYSDYSASDEEVIVKKKRKTSSNFIDEMFKNSGSSNDEKDIAKYFSKLSENDKENMFSQLKEINNYKKLDKPKIFQIMSFPIPTNQKNHILKQYITLLNSHLPDNKLRVWFDAILSLPFGQYKGIDLKSFTKPKKITKFLNKLNNIMDSAVWGHNDAKRQIIQMMGQQIRNPGCKGSVLGIWGPPGNGKTTLIKEGIAMALNKPFIFISLGGATDSSFLDGHSYTYEGSVCGRIANAIITSGCMDPIIYFDELDKISKTPKGEEIVNLLVHLTDPVQNTHFRDKYFHGIDIDLSRATIIFSFNNISNVNPILLDRITTIETKFIMKPHKIHIAQNYLLPAIMKETGLDKNDITINDNILDNIIEKYTKEGGVRKLKSILYNIVREVNLANLMKTKILNKEISFPFVLKKKHMRLFMKNKVPIQPEKISNFSKVGFITGMYASSMGVGGVLPIQILWIPSSQPMALKTTGNLKKVIKESTHVATSLAWNNLSKDLQTSYLKQWKEKPVGFHIHCPDGSVPKDGPSAGTALTVALYSMLTNKPIRHDIAITGEITLDGKVTAIGGLEEKLVGAKKAGVRLALVPKENAMHLDKVNERNPNLLDDNFNVILIDTLNDAIQHSFLN